MKKLNKKNATVNVTGVEAKRLAKHTGNAVVRAAKTTGKVVAKAAIFEIGGLGFRALRNDVVQTAGLIHDEVKNVPLEARGAFGKTKYVDRHTGAKVRGYKPVPKKEFIPNQDKTLAMAGAIADCAAGAGAVVVMNSTVNNAIDGIGGGKNVTFEQNIRNVARTAKEVADIAEDELDEMM